jgi:cation-transporting ATPase 13A2
MFSGPMSESIPSSVVSFAHRRSRQNSTVSFTSFRQEEREDNDNALVDWDEEEAIDVADEFDVTELNGLLEGRDEVASLSLSKTRSASRGSVEDPLLSRSESFDHQQFRRKVTGRVNQRIYIVTEDMQASITGFSTSLPGFAAYLTICVLTCGIGYLFFRWLPKLRVRLVGTPTPLQACEWVAVEVSTSLPGLFHVWLAQLSANRINGTNLQSTRSTVKHLNGHCRPFLLFLIAPGTNQARKMKKIRTLSS